MHARIRVATAASGTIKQRRAAAPRRRGVRAQTLLGLASTQLGVPVASLTVANGVVSGGGKSVTYGELVGGKLFNIDDPRDDSEPRASPCEAGRPYTLVGTRVPRIDIPAEVTGTYTYIQNVRVPGMLHGRVVRPRGQGAYGTGAPDRLGRRELDRAHPERPVSAGRLPRRRRAARVRRDPGRGAAEGAWQETPRFPGAGTSTSRCGSRTQPG